MLHCVKPASVPPNWRLPAACTICVSLLVTRSLPSIYSTWLAPVETDKVYYLQEQYSVVYQSKQSYYDLMQAAGWSYHKSEKRNPKRDEALVQERREAIKKNGRSTGSR